MGHLNISHMCNCVQENLNHNANMFNECIKAIFHRFCQCLCQHGVMIDL